MTRDRAAHCDECRHFDADIVPHEGWPCVKGHKPRFYTPKTVMQAESGRWVLLRLAGWKRRCDDFEKDEGRSDE